MKKTKAEELKLWRFLTNFWGIVTAIFFIITFFNVSNLQQPLKSLVIVYVSILSIYTGIKEFNRWKDKKFMGKHNGEIFIVIWTILVILFIILNAYDPIRYRIPKEFTATYLSILGVFAISRKSKYLRMK